MAQKRHIVALGSSFAAGAGISPIIDRTAWRSGNNYAHILASRLDARLTDLTSSGATLLNVLDQPQQHMLGSTLPQLERLPADADIVTLTAGGNDMGYIGGMVRDAVKASVHAVPLLGEMFPPHAHEDEEILDIGEVIRRFVAIIDRIDSIARNATIYLVEYLTVLGKHAKPAPINPLTVEQIEHHRLVGTRLQQAYDATIARRPKVKLVKMTAPSDSHDVGSAEPWVTGFTASMLLQGGCPYHPNAAGHRATSDAIYQQLLSDGAVQEK